SGAPKPLQRNSRQRVKDLSIKETPMPLMLQVQLLRIMKTSNGEERTIPVVRAPLQWAEAGAAAWAAEAAAGGNFWKAAAAQRLELLAAAPIPAAHTTKRETPE